MNIIGIVLIFCLIILLIRRINYKEIDDVHPLIQCKQRLLARSKFLWVIPLFEGVPITDHPEWIAEIKKLEKDGAILGMHGVYHTEAKDMFYRDGEFNKDLPVEYIKQGMEIFKNAFGYYPKYFKAPHCLCNENNRKIIESLGMIYKGVGNQIAHKVYHCNDESLPWYLGEKIVDLF